MSLTFETIDLTAVTRKQQTMWSSGDFGVIASLIHIVAERLADSADLVAGSRVLDVAGGTGNAAIAAARCGCDVTCTDYVPALLERGRERANAEGFDITFAEADAEALPCDDGEYDAVFSVVGVMFAPNQEAAAGEIVRVCRPGRTIALASWTPDGFIGQLLKTVSRHVPPPPGVRPPVQWGAEERLRELFGDRITDLRTTRRDFVFRFTSAEDLADYFRANYGPTLKAFEAVGADGAKALHEDLVELANQHNSADDGTLKIRSGYLQALAYRA